MEKLERNFMGHSDQGPPNREAENQSRQDQNRYLVRRKCGVAVEVYDISQPNDLVALCANLTRLEQNLSQAPAYLHPEWILSTDAPKLMCRECAEEVAEAERSEIIPADISCPICGGLDICHTRLSGHGGPNRVLDTLLLYCGDCGYTGSG